MIRQFVIQCNNNSSYRSNDHTKLKIKYERIKEYIETFYGRNKKR